MKGPDWARSLSAAVILSVGISGTAAAASQLRLGLYHPQSLRAVAAAEPGRPVLLLGQVTVTSDVTGVQATLRLPADTQFLGGIRAPLGSRVEFSNDGQTFGVPSGPSVRAVRFTLGRTVPGVSYPVGLTVEVGRAR